MRATVSFCLSEKKYVYASMREVFRPYFLEMTYFQPVCLYCIECEVAIYEYTYDYGG